MDLKNTTSLNSTLPDRNPPLSPMANLKRRGDAASQVGVQTELPGGRIERTQLYIVIPFH